MRQEVLDKLHNTLLEIMDVVDKVCREKGITYYLAGGTLLGAVRHKGFIPWDDDMDIMMPRRDYEKFCSIFSSVASDKYFILSSDVNPRYWKSHAKVCKKGTLFQEKMGKEQSIFVDIFPLDEAKSRNGLFQRIRFSAIKISDRIAHWRNYKDYNPGKARLWCYLTVFLPLDKIREFQKCLRVLKNSRNDCFFLFESVAIYGADRSLWPKSTFETTILTEFEGRKYSIPSGYDSILSITYHNYMQLPPIEQRRVHNPKRLSFDVNGPDEILD